MKHWFVAALIILLGGMLILRTYDVGRLDEQDRQIIYENKLNYKKQLELIQLLHKEEKTAEDYYRIDEILSDIDRM